MKKDEVEKWLSDHERWICDRKNRKQFRVSSAWNSQVPKDAGVYAFFENGKMIYVGESRSLRRRMKEVCITPKHTFRRKLGKDRLRYEEDFEKPDKGKYFPDTIETKLNELMATLDVAVMPVTCGRAEIEECLIARYNPPYNSTAKRTKL